MRYKPKPVRAETLHITLASSKQIQRWAQRRLSNGSIVGEVTMIDTVRQKNLKPTRDGLFCERIFGPVKDFVCSCGKYHSPPKGLRYCPDCEVDIISSKTRRYRLGYIKLKSLVVHSWFYREKHQNPLLDLLESENKKVLELFVYCLSKFKSLHNFQPKKRAISSQKGDHTAHRVGRTGLRSLPPPLASLDGRYEWSLFMPGYSVGTGLRSPSRSRWGFDHPIAKLLSSSPSKEKVHQPQLAREQWLNKGAGQRTKIRWKRTGWKPCLDPFRPRIEEAPRLVTFPYVYRLKRVRSLSLFDRSYVQLQTSNHRLDGNCLQATNRRRADVGKQTQVRLRANRFATDVTATSKARERLRKAIVTPLCTLSAGTSLWSKWEERKYTAVVRCTYLQRARIGRPRAAQLFSWRNPAGVGTPFRHTCLLVNSPIVGKTIAGDEGAGNSRPALERAKTLLSMRALSSFVTTTPAPMFTNWLTHSQPMATAGFNSGGRGEGGGTGWGQTQPVLPTKQVFAQRGWFCCLVSLAAAFTAQQPIGWHIKARLLDRRLPTGTNSPSVRAFLPVLGSQAKKGERDIPRLTSPVWLETFDQQAEENSPARWEMARAGRRASLSKNPYLLANTACQQESCLQANAGLSKGFGQLYYQQNSPPPIPVYKNREVGYAYRTTLYRGVRRDWQVAASAVWVKKRAEVDRLACCSPSSFDQATSKKWLPTQAWIPLLLAGSFQLYSDHMANRFDAIMEAVYKGCGKGSANGRAEAEWNAALKEANAIGNDRPEQEQRKSHSFLVKSGPPPIRRGGAKADRKGSVTASAADKWYADGWGGSHTQQPLISYYDTILKRRLFQSAFLLFWGVIFASWSCLAATAPFPPPTSIPTTVRWMGGSSEKARGLFALSQVCLLTNNPNRLGSFAGGKPPSQLLWGGGSQVASKPPFHSTIKRGLSRGQLGLFVSRHRFYSEGWQAPPPSLLSIEPHLKTPTLCHLFDLLIELRVRSRSDYSPSQGIDLLQGQPGDAAYKKSWISRWNHQVLRQTGPLACFLALSGHQTLKLPHRLRFSLISLHEVCAKIPRLLLLLAVTSPSEKKEMRRLRLAIKKQLFVRSRLILRLKLAASLPNIASKRMTPNTLPRMFLSALPVLPPALRPIITIDDQVAVADANRLYQSVLNRNIRLWATPDILFGQCVLQESVDNLIGSVRRSPLGSPVGVDLNRRPLKSLSDVLKGKKGRFRQNLLGKRVDYSGRSVIVVGPTLKVHECGLPQEMAIELFQPFIIRTIMRVWGVESIFEAKMLLENDRPLLWLLIEQVLTKYPVFLNRAPTLHRLGIQAFQPKMVEGRAVLLHPLVCAAFNADFDGDQMAVHVPLSVESCSESWTILWSRFHLLSPATGEPSMLPTQDMVLGCYYLTTPNPHYQLGGVRLFASVHDALRACYQGVVAVHQSVWVKMVASFETDCDSEEVEEVRITPHGGTVEIYHSLQCRFGGSGEGVSRAVRTTPGRAIINMVLGLSQL